MGSGRIMADPDNVFCPLDDPEMIKDHVKSLERDLDRLGISIRDKIVTDVGTGRQAIAASMLGARQVFHYDISEKNVQNLQAYIETHRPGISTKQVDLVEHQPESADLVYLHGIVQHFSHTGKGLRNCLTAVKMGGHVWLYFYRSGTFKHFAYFLLRDLILGVGHRKNIDDYFVNATLLYSDHAQPNYLVSGAMDNFFVDYINLYEPKTYLEFLRQAGFKLTFSSKLEPLDAVNHSLHESVIVGAQRISQGEPDVELLSPTESINQLDLPYDNPLIAETVRTYQELKANLPEYAVKPLCLSLCRFINDARIQDLEANHQHLQTVFKNLLAIVGK